MSVLILLALLPISIGAEVIVGGISDDFEASTLSSPKFVVAGVRAAEPVTNYQNGTTFWVFQKITRGRYQPVAGVLYYFEGVFGESTCQRDTRVGNTMFEFLDCDVSENAPRALFSFEYFEQTWTNTRDIQNILKIRDISADEQI